MKFREEGPRGLGDVGARAEGMCERSQGRDLLVSDTETWAGAKPAWGIGELTWNVWEAKARPGVAHRLRLEEREGTIGGGGGSRVTFVEKVGGDRNQLLMSSAPPRGQGNEALVTLEVRGGTKEVGGEEVGVMLTDSAADEGVVVRTMKRRILAHMSATETSAPTHLLSNEPETGYIFFKTF